jgi:hypothetical protein
MEQIRQKNLECEPIGIVISRGAEPESPPRFWAYVWGQFEEPQGTALTESSPAMG